MTDARPRAGTNGGGSGSPPAEAEASPDSGWQPTVALLRATLSALALITIALLWRRPDLLVIATPLALVATLSLSSPPTEGLHVSARLGRRTLREGEATRWRGVITGDEQAELVTAVFGDAPWVERQPDRGVVTTRATAGRATVEIGVRSTRWGTRPTGSASVIAASSWGSYRWRRAIGRYRLTTLPVPAVFDSSASSRPTDGLIGLHRSSRSGEGNEFATVRAFRAGDRMRRINWPRSARATELLVNATFADLDTHIALIVDASRDIGVSDGVDGRSSSLDATVRAAGAIAEHYAPRGERVSLHTFGAGRPEMVPPAAGHGQLQRILDALASVRPPDPSDPTPSARAHDSRGLAGSRMTVMVSPLVVRSALDHAVSLGRHGLSVIVVDTLPDDVTSEGDVYAALAWRIRLLERRRELRLVQAAGIPVVRWRGPGSLDEVIRDISRRAAAPRMVRR